VGGLIAFSMAGIEKEERDFVSLASKFFPSLHETDQIVVAEN